MNDKRKDQLVRIQGASKAVLYFAVYGATYGALSIGELLNAGYYNRHTRYAISDIKDTLLADYDRKQIDNALYNLQKRKLILKDGEYVKFNTKKVAALDQLNVLSFVPQKQKWDGKWRIVTFDIPEEHRVYRDLVRRKLIEVGAVYVHKSVWLTPVDISPLVNYLRERVGLHDNLLLIEAKTISNQKYFLKKFNLIQ